MVCQVRYLSSAGIHRREITGITALERAFPPQWLLYASLQCFPRGEPPIEMDAMVVMDDRVLILELKDFNGRLTQSGDLWVSNRRRFRSPVQGLSMKARKVKSFLQAGIPGFNYFVDFRVVLTGSATKADLAPADQAHVWNLQEAESIATTVRRLLNRVTLQTRKAFALEADFERITHNTMMFAPLDVEWDGHRVVEEDFVVHPDRIWREHRAEQISDQRYKALLRVWAFDRLPAGLNSPDRRQLIARRERRAIGRLFDLGSPLLERNAILTPVGDEKDEILTQHFELRRLNSGQTTLDRYFCVHSLRTQTPTMPDQTNSAMPSVEPPFSIRSFLREREALLVHFSTLMSNHPELVFPNDLWNAMTLRDKPLSFSTILAGDVGPYQIPTMDPADANAAGSIGIIVDIPSDDCVITVGANDDGTSCNPQTAEIISGGFAPSPESCARSIDERTSSNEWLVRGFRPVAIFAFVPIWVRHPEAGEVPLNRDLAFRQFPGCRIFSALEGRFVEFDRGTGEWMPVTYETIMNATPQ